MTQGSCRIKTALTVLILAGLATTVLANEIQLPPQGHGHHHGPPPELFQACKDKSAGDKIHLKTPQGEAIQAICEPRDSRLIARPLNPGEKRQK